LSVLIPVAIAGLLLLGYVLWWRAQELFRIEIRGGKPAVVRGHVPVGLLNDFGAAVRGVQRGETQASSDNPGTCRALHAGGESCESAAECVSGDCTDGACSARPCAG
jgi:hypothetical protein